MFISYDEFLNVKEMKNGKVVSGENGLDRPIKMAVVVEVPDVEKWIDEGELVFITGVGLKNIEVDLCKIVESIYKKKAAGLVVICGDYIPEVPENVKELSNKLNIPIIENPFNIRITDILQGIYKKLFKTYAEEKSMSDFFRELAYQEYDEEFLDKAKYYGYNPNKSFLVAIIYINKIDNDENRDGILKIMSSLFNKNREKFLYFYEGKKYFVMLQKDKKKSNEILDKIKGNIKEKYKNCEIIIGVGNEYSNIKYYYKSMKEAEKSLKMLMLCKRKDGIRNYNELGIYRILFNTTDKEEIKEIYIDILGELVKYDKRYSGELLFTLEKLLMNNCNILKTSQELYIHRNTLRNRIERIEEILFCDLNDENVRFNLILALKIKKFLGEDIYE